MNTQIELRAEVSPELADELEAHFYETESIAWGLMQKERNDPYEVFGIFPDEAAADSALSALRQDFPQLPEDFECNTLIEADWQNAYKTFVQPWSDRKLHWIPLWERENVTPPDGSAVVYLDAGMAFGTGSHETTRLCARRLQDLMESNPDGVENITIIDAGCGSGVLAFSAAALGFKQVSGFDFDPEAIIVCKSNAKENPHIPAIAFSVADLEAGLRNQKADFLMANIQTDVLVPHSDAVIMGIKAGGTLALSGILATELEKVRAHYQACFANLRSDLSITVDSRTDGEWSDLVFWTE